MQVALLTRANVTNERECPTTAVSYYCTKNRGRKLQNRRDFDRDQKRARTRVKVFFCEEEREVG